MIDTVHTELSLTVISSKQLNNLRSIITGTETKYNHETASELLIGHYKNFQVTITDKRVTVNGSLSKYYFGNNVQTLSFSEVNIALLQLSKELGIPLLRGEIRRIDMALSIPLDHNIVKYYKSFADTPRYSKDTHKHGIRYTRGNIVLALYDKTFDAVTSNQFTHGGDVLRIELRIMKRVRRTVSPTAKKLFLLQLLSSTMKTKLVQLWIKHYTSIEIKKTFTDLTVAKGWKDCSKYLMLEGIKNIELCNWLNEIDQLAKVNNWSAETKSDVKKKSREVYSTSHLASKNDYIEEINQKIDQVLRSRTKGYLLTYTN